MIPIISILLAFLLPIFVIRKAGTQKPLQRPYLFSVGSFIFCTVAVIEEIYVIKKRLLAGDIGGIEDTIGAVLLTCIAVLIVTVILNLLSMGLSYEKDGENDLEDR